MQCYCECIRTTLRTLGASEGSKETFMVFRMAVYRHDLGK